MRGLAHDGLRAVISASIVALGRSLAIVQRAKLYSTSARRWWLRRRFRLSEDTGIVGWSSALERRLHDEVGVIRREIALTSGTSASPKRVPYTAHRLRRTRFAFTDAYARACSALGVHRASLYVFGSLKVDGSLTSLLLDEGDRLPFYLSTLQAPYRLERHPAMRALASTYGTTASRLFTLTLSNPGVLYATNPSTLCSFFEDLESDWPLHSQLVRTYRNEPERFDRTTHAIAKRLWSRGTHERMERVATSRALLPIDDFAPAVTSYICWTGGYVAPFLERLERYLPTERFRRIPMYSMSTEVIETLPYYVGSKPRFLPIADGVYYEFIEEGKRDRPENLIAPDQLEIGSSYAMVVSDSHGLRRYQTGDVFACHGFVGELPDLEFLGRRDVEYSFTGEKLTADQLSIVFRDLRRASLSVRTDDVLTCVPSSPPAPGRPHYKVIVLSRSRSPTPSEAQDGDGKIAEYTERRLRGLNREYREKRLSGRLGPVEVTRMPWPSFVTRLSGSDSESSWENQLKLLPLLRRTWEALSG